MEKIQWWHKSMNIIKKCLENHKFGIAYQETITSERSGSVTEMCFLISLERAWNAFELISYYVVLSNFIRKIEQHWSHCTIGSRSGKCKKKNISKINSMKVIRNFKHLNVNLTLLLRPSLSVMISIWILRHKPIKNKKQHV